MKRKRPSRMGEHFEARARQFRELAAALPRCARCPHAHHQGLCTERMGGTAYACGCSCGEARAAGDAR